jgi:hypothetical protein
MEEEREKSALRDFADSVVRFLSGFRRSSARDAAQQSVNESSAHVDRITAAFPDAGIDSEGAKQILARYQSVREDQERIRQLSNRIALLMALVAFFGTPVLTARRFRRDVDFDFFWSYLIEVLIVTFVALLPFRTRKYPSLRSARSTFFGSGYASMIVTGLIVSGYAGVAWVGSRTWSDSVPSAMLVAALYGSVLLVVILLVWAFFSAALPPDAGA